MQKYETKVVWSEGRLGELYANETRIKCSPPQNFRGYDNTMTPEHAFVGSAEMCICMTFLTMIEKAGVDLSSYECEAEGLLEKVDGKLKFTKIIIRPRIKVKDEGDVVKAKEAIKKAEIYALVTNSMNTKVIIEADIGIE